MNKRNFLSQLLCVSLALPVSAVANQASAASDLNSFLQQKVEGVNTDAVIVMRDGKILFESYARGYTKQTKHLSWSMAKTIAGIIVGQEIHRGGIGLNRPISDYVTQVKTKATVRDVLNMSSGVGFKEEYSGVPVNSDATKMLYLQGPKVGMSSFVSSLSSLTQVEPGKYFYYSSGDTNLLMAALRKSAKSQADYNGMPFRNLFTPLGITDATFEQDSKGVFVGSSYVYLTARDFAKIGQLFADRGMHNGVRIIPHWYFELMSQLAPGVNVKALTGTSQTRAYSSQLTTNLPITGRNLPSEYADLPTDALLMIGHQGQLVIASPSQKLVIVRLGMDKGPAFDRKAFLGHVAKFVESKTGELLTARKENPSQYQNKAVTPIAAAGEGSDTSIFDYLKVPHLTRALAAKEYCSCINVVGRSEDDCKADLKVSLPVLPSLNVDKDTKAVSAYFGLSFIGKKSVAQYRGTKLGCTLTESE